MLNSLFVTDSPEVEIIEGLVCVHFGTKNFYFRPSTFRRFIEEATQQLNAFDAEQRGTVPFRKG